MKKIFIDTETTGLNPGNIIQLTYCICDINKEGKEKVSLAKNFFFNVDYINPAAEAVHGFSKEKLKFLSQGMKFKDVAQEVCNDFKNGIFIAHNVNFDKKFVVSEFSNFPDLDWMPKEFFCTMEYFKPILQLKNAKGRLKKPRLEETVEFLNINKSTILQGAKRLFNCSYVDFHDARYDVAALVSCYYRAKKMGYI
ncbi:hypothetical protein CLOACE_05040 [Clostridium acetireducens DSM 10703]|uniref:Exonuclease domain-containing protein n=1 Tax=Clostridium acetireducens DSM 10703 TaxID=1121290 RepID=A0A1E8F0W9_9CLOT|nr:3'-5' exonuclease [Clostridium acetireducens]OFI07099.1 hypothetical protein CLOACE_05040 [Clostridium acetireducens DSM 10703]